MTAARLLELRDRYSRERWPDVPAAAMSVALRAVWCAVRQHGGSLVSLSVVRGELRALELARASEDWNLLQAARLRVVTLHVASSPTQLPPADRAAALLSPSGMGLYAWASEVGA